MHCRAFVPLLCTALCLSANSVLAGPGSPLFDQGLAAFNGAQYQQAADFFYRELSNNPQDPLAHYYLGVSAHCLGRYPDATREYNWVLLNSQDPELIKRVQLGLKALARVQGKTPPAAASASLGASAAQAAAPTPPQPQAQPYSAAAGQGASLIPPGASYQPPAPTYGQAPAAAYSTTTAPWLSSAGQQKASEALDNARPPIGATGQLRIVDVYTKWCGWCKKFEPYFHLAQQKYNGRISFERVDAEARNSKDFVKKYRVNGYPTLLFFDAKGKLVNRVDGAPQSFEEFDGLIGKAFPRLNQ